MYWIPIVLGYWPNYNRSTEYLNTMSNWRLAGQIQPSSSLCVCILWELVRNIMYAIQFYVVLPKYGIHKLNVPQCILILLHTHYQYLVARCQYMLVSISISFSCLEQWHSCQVVVASNIKKVTANQNVVVSVLSKYTFWIWNCACRLHKLHNLYCNYLLCKGLIYL